MKFRAGPAMKRCIEGRRRSGICIRDDARRQRGQAASILLETKYRLTLAIKYGASTHKQKYELTAMVAHGLQTG